MDSRSTLHWSALVLAVYSVIWLLSFVDALAVLVVLLPLLAVAGFILALIHVRHIGSEDRGLVYTGAIIGLVAHAGWIFLRLVSLPIAVNTGGVNTTTDPPEVLDAGSNLLTGLLPLFGAIAIALTFWPIWGPRDRILGGGGAALVVLVQVLSFLLVVGSTALGTIFSVLFALGFLLLAVALVLSIVSPSHPHWAPEARA